MQIYALTTERVSKLQAQRDNKEKELNELLKLTVKDLWNRDLDELSAAWEDVLESDIRARSTDKGKKKSTSKFAKVSKKRVSDVNDGEYMEKKPKIAKTKANASPRGQTKITSFAAKPSES